MRHTEADSEKGIEGSASSGTGTLTEHYSTPAPVNPKKTLSLVERIKSLAPHPLLFTIFALVVTLSQILWFTSFTDLQTDLRRAQEELTQAKTQLTETKQELEKVKTDFAIAIKQARLNNPATTYVDPKNSDAGHLNVTIAIGSSIKLFGNKLTISLIDTQFKSNPSRYIVNAAISSPDQPEMKIKNAEVGFIADYLQEKGFTIEIVSVDGFSAMFSVKRN